MHIAHYTRSQLLVETTSASSQSCSGSGRGSSQFPHIDEGGGLGGDELKDELMFDKDADAEADNMAGLSLGIFRCLATMLDACQRISRFGSSGVVKKGIPLMCIARK